MGRYSPGVGVYNVQGNARTPPTEGPSCHAAPRRDPCRPRTLSRDLRTRTGRRRTADPRCAARVPRRLGRIRLEHRLAVEAGTDDRPAEGGIARDPGEVAIAESER